MNRKEVRTLQKMAREENKHWPFYLRSIPREQWPVSAEELAARMPHGVPIAVWRSNRFIAQLFKDQEMFRLSVNRTEVGEDGKFLAAITWDDLQQIKAECGFGTFWAVEIYPDHRHLVNIANMRHLWILPEPPQFGWKKN